MSRLRNTVMFGLISQLEDGQILNYMAELPVDKLVHLASIMREMNKQTEEVRYANLAEAALQELSALGITLVEDIL